MDHHCPYINNCVGRANLRPFLLFLFWVSFTGLYGVLCGYLYLRTYWSIVLSSRQVLHHFLQRYWIPYIAMWHAARATPGHLLVMMYLILICGTLGLTVGGLLLMQLRYVLIGKGYVSALKERKRDGKGAKKGRAQWRFEHVQRVFGKGPVATWILPRSGPPPGALVWSHVPHTWEVGSSSTGAAKEL